MSRPSRFPEAKQPFEEYPITVAFTLDEGETVDTCEATAWDLTANADASDEIINVLGATEALGVVSVPVQGGTSGHIYKLTVRITTDSTPPRKLEKDVLMPVVES